MTKNKSNCTIIIFGASGDLTQRKLIPALHSIACEDLLPADLDIIGVGRTKLTDEQFREQLKTGVKKYGRFKPKVWEGFAKRLRYISGSYDEKKTYQTIQKHAQKNQLFYLAVPPSTVLSIVTQLGDSDLNKTKDGWRRLIAEKPFGRDLESARQLNKDIQAVFRENQIYRIDHYLGKETVQNILTLRFANAIFEPLWNLKYIHHVQMTAAEQDGIGSRGEYYENAGILRDIFQNHMLQLLTLITMEPPVIWQADAFRDEKVKVLQAIRPIKHSLRGQYNGSQQIASYREEENIPPQSETATYAAIRVFVDNWRWRGVPFYLRSGKRLAAKSTSITIQFKQVPHLLFPESDMGNLPANILSLCIQPNEGIQLFIQGKEPGAGMKTRSMEIDYNYAQDFDSKSLPAAYERLLLDAIAGDVSLFAREDEINLSWKIIDPIIKEWEKPNSTPLHFYEPNSWGPKQAKTFLEEDGCHWFSHCLEEENDNQKGKKKVSHEK